MPSPPSPLPFISDAPLVWLPPANKAQGTALFCRAVILGCLAVVAIDGLVDDDAITSSRIALLLFFACIVLWGCQGPRWPFLRHVLLGWESSTAPRVYYRATLVQPGYEPILQALAATLQQGRETGIQFAAYVHGELVVDVVGGIFREQEGDKYNNIQLPLTSDTYSCVWSSSKVVTSILMAWLVDQGHLQYHTKICDYWPEFTGGGKEDLIVADVLHHNAGLANPPQGENALILEDVFPKNILKGNASKKIEAMGCRFPQNRDRHFTYHGMTRGWILNEIARRVDPQHRTLGVILREEFTQPLQIDSECYLGMPQGLCHPATNPKLRLLDPVPPFAWVVCNWLCQWLLLVCSCCCGLAFPTMEVQWGFPIIYTAFITFVTLHWTTANAFRNPQRLDTHTTTQLPQYLHGETPSANIQSSARALAAIANSLVTTRLPHNPIFSDPQRTLKQMAQHETTKLIMPLKKVTYNDGGVCVLSAPDKTNLPELPGIPYAWGWFGFNGSVLAFHPRGDFVMAFQPFAFNELNPRERIRQLSQTFMKCAQTIHGPGFGNAVDMTTTGA